MESGNRKWMVPFFTIWTGQQLSIVGSRAAQFALVWWLTLETGSSAVLAAASLVALAPQILLGPFAGALVDRWNRRVVIIVAHRSGGALVSVSVLVRNDGGMARLCCHAGTLPRRSFPWTGHDRFHDPDGARETLHPHQRTESDDPWVTESDWSTIGSFVAGHHAIAWCDAG